MGKRILVTGSRDWTDVATINAALLEHATRRDVVVHGGADGADSIADQRHRLLPGASCETWEAQWAEFGKAAGPRRNQAMVDSGVDLCLAFIRNDSRGATDCLMRASSAGVPVVVYRRDES